MSKKRILFILQLPPPVHGSSIVGGYMKDSELINQTFHGEFVNLNTSASIVDIGKKPIHKINRYLNIISQVIKQLKRLKPDICYMSITTKGIGFYKDALIVSIVKRFKVKIIYHFHNKGVALHQHRFMDHILYRFVFKNSYAILLSEYLYPDIQKYFQPQAVFYCPNGIPDLYPKKVENKTQKTNLLFLSNLIQSKGIYILLDACKILKEEKTDFHCDIIGAESPDISKYDFIEEIKKRGLSDHIEYHGPKYDDAKCFHLKRADILVLPTFQDCFPLVLIEAMQYRLPIVSTFEGGIPDLVVDKETGFLCKHHDSDGLAEKLTLLIKNKELRSKLGENGYKHFRKNFTLDIFEKKMVDILSSI